MCIDWVDEESLMTELHAKPYWREGVQWQYGQFAEQNPSLLNLVIERKYSMYQNYRVSYRNGAIRRHTDESPEAVKMFLPVLWWKEAMYTEARTCL